MNTKSISKAALGAMLIALAGGSTDAFLDTPSAADLGLLKCQRTLTKETAKATTAAAKMYRKALDAGIKDFHTRPEVSAKTEQVFLSSLRRVSDSRVLGKSIEEKAEERIVAACDPDLNAFTNADLLGLPDATAQKSLKAKSLEAVSITVDGAPATIDSVQDLAKFAASKAVAEAIPPIFKSSANAPGILGAVKQKLETKSPPADDPTMIVDVLDILEKVERQVDADGDGEVDPNPTTMSTSTSSTTTTSSSTSTIPSGPVCGNCLWEPGEECDPCHPQAGSGCQSDCTCDGFGICNYF
jgi:hypothetical protein